MTYRRAKVYFKEKIAGELRETEEGYEFIYDASFLSDPEAQPLSVNLPLQENIFQSSTLFPFFQGLLREGWLLDLTSAALKIDKNDRFGFLLRSGEDAIGAVSVRPVGDE